MKQVVLVVALLVVCSISLFGQTTSNVAGTWSVGVGLEGGVPTGDFSNLSSLGIGGVASLHYMVDENLSLGVKAGYIHFSGKDVTEGGVTVTGPALNVIPVLVGARYFFMPPADMRVYGQAEVGLYSMSTGDVTVGGVTVPGESRSKFGFAPTLGAQFKAGDKMNVDVHANYSMIFDALGGSGSSSSSAANFVGFGIGLEFGL